MKYNPQNISYSFGPVNAPGVSAPNTPPEFLRELEKLKRDLRKQRLKLLNNKGPMFCFIVWCFLLGDSIGNILFLPYAYTGVPFVIGIISIFGMIVMFRLIIRNDKERKQLFIDSL